MSNRSSKRHASVFSADNDAYKEVADKNTQIGPHTPHLSRLLLPLGGHQIVVEKQRESPLSMPTVGQRQAGGCGCDRERFVS